MPLTTLDEILAAAESIRDRVHRTPLLTSQWVSERLREVAGQRPGAVLLKAENLQITGSFKVRGVLNRVRSLGNEERRRGLITISAGNHAAALAWGAAAEGIACTVVMPRDADPSKVEASRGYGAEVILHGDVSAAFSECFRLRDERGLTFVHPFDDPAIIAGAGTVGLEITDDVPDVDVVVVPVGGGGLISGVAAAVKARRPDARVYGVEPEGAPGLSRALEAGEIVRLEAVNTIAGGLAPPFCGELALAHAQALVEDVVLIRDTALIDAMRGVLRRSKLLVEPSGAAGVAALLAGRIPVRSGEAVAVILSGGNTSLDVLAA